MSVGLTALTLWFLWFLLLETLKSSKGVVNRTGAVATRVQLEHFTRSKGESSKRVPFLRKHWQILPFQTAWKVKKVH